MRTSMTLDLRALGLVTDAAADGLSDAAEFLLEQANRTVPLDDATLEGSGTVTVDRDQLRATVSYDTPYAVRQHEELRYRHAPGRRAKWLEHTFKEDGQAALDHVASRVRRVLS